MENVTRYIVPKAQAWPEEEQDTPRMAHEQVMVLARDYDALLARFREAVAGTQVQTGQRMAGGRL